MLPGRDALGVDGGRGDAGGKPSGPSRVSLDQRRSCEDGGGDASLESELKIMFSIIVLFVVVVFYQKPSQGLKYLMK